jgi:hypothetical protein
VKTAHDAARRAGDGSRRLGISPALINDAFVVFALGLFGVMWVEMWLRAKRLRNETPGTASAEERD